MKCLIGVKNNGDRYIQFGYNEKNKHKDTLAYTNEDLTDEEIQEIRECTLNELQNILFNYI